MATYEGGQGSHVDTFGENGHLRQPDPAISEPESEAF